MVRLLYIIFITLIVSNCSFKKVVKQHGVPFLEKKQKDLVIDISNKNDITKILGQPSTKSKFDNDVWIYIERRQTQSDLKNLGQMKIIDNNVLVLEIDNYGVLKQKKFYNINDMKKIKIDKSSTKTAGIKKSFIYDFMSSMRQKINDPLEKKKKKRKEINQR